MKITLPVILSYITKNESLFNNEHTHSHAHSSALKNENENENAPPSSLVKSVKPRRHIKNNDP